MPVVIQTNSPLEERLRELATNSVQSFPNRTANYFVRYALIKQHLADAYYASTAAGLALQGERYTRHDIGHVDDVIHVAGALIGFGAESEAKSPVYTQFVPYEVFALLLATLLHDAGNAAGRQGHEKAPLEILQELGDITDLEPLERRIISQIAEAHGGSIAGSRDTITRVIQTEAPNIGPIRIRARRLAAILRFADELSENPRRADPQALRTPYNPPESAIHNLYCKVINVSVDYVGHSVAMDYEVEKEQLDEEFVIRENGKPRQILLIDYIASRLEKAEQERRYCSRFLSNFATYDRLRVRLSIFDANRQIDELAFVLEDSGYPSLSTVVKQTKPAFDGVRLRNKHCRPAMSGELA